MSFITPGTGVATGAAAATNGANGFAKYDSSGNLTDGGNLTVSGTTTLNGPVVFGGSATITGTIISRNGSGAYGGTLATGELYIDTTNGAIYLGTAGGNVSIESLPFLTSNGFVTTSGRHRRAFLVMDGGAGFRFVGIVDSGQYHRRRRVFCHASGRGQPHGRREHDDRQWRGAARSTSMAAIPVRQVRALREL